MAVRKGRHFVFVHHCAMRRVLAVVVVIATAAAGLLIWRGDLRFNYLSRTRYPIQGVDVSHHQRAIDWQRLRAQQTDFAYIKATQGMTFRDPAFVRNWRGAQRAGVVPGAYHFYSFCSGGAQQAASFVAALASAPGPSLPPVVDLELGANCAPPPRDVVLRELRAFLDVVERSTRRRTILYVDDEFYAAYLRDELLANPLWVRSIFHAPRFTGSRPWLLWQYANRGHREGVEEWIDLDAFAGDAQTFRSYVR